MSRRAKLTPDAAGLAARSNRRVAGLRRSEVATPRRRQRRVLRQARARRDRRSVRLRAGRHLTRAAARRHRARTPARPRARGRRHPVLRPPVAAAKAAVHRARACSGLCRRSRRRRVRPRPAPEPARDQRAGARVLLAADRRRRPHAESRPVPVPRPRVARLLPGLGPVRRDVRRASCGTRPAATRTTRGCRTWSASSPRAATPSVGLWGAHDVRTHGAGTKRFRHPVVGDVTLAYEELAITAEPGQVLLIYTAEPGSPSAERLRLLASWAADHPVEVPR